MSKRLSRTLLIFVPFLAVTILVTAAMLAGGSAGGTLPSGRSVMTHSDSILLSSTFSFDTATIETAGKKIVVQPTALVVDGVTVASINENVADVQVRVERVVVAFLADGKPIRTASRKSRLVRS